MGRTGADGIEAINNKTVDCDAEIPEFSSYGLLEALRVPRVVYGPVDFQLFDKYERRRPDVDAAIGQLFLQGVGTRRLRRIAEALFGCAVSAITASRTTGYLDEESREYRTK